MSIPPGTPPYNFPDSPNTACFVCSHVLSREYPILNVTHDHSDGAWQFLCGKDEHEISTAKIICLEDAVKMDAALNELSEMPIGTGARRKSVNDKWQFYELPDDME